MDPRCARFKEFDTLSEPSIQHKMCHKRQSRFAAAILETHYTRLGQSQTVAIHGENMSTSPVSIPKHHFQSAAGMAKNGEIDWVSLKQ